MAPTTKQNENDHFVPDHDESRDFKFVLLEKNECADDDDSFFPKQALPDGVPEASIRVCSFPVRSYNRCRHDLAS